MNAFTDFDVNPSPRITVRDRRSDRDARPRCTCLLPGFHPSDRDDRAPIGRHDSHHADAIAR